VPSPRSAHDDPRALIIKVGLGVKKVAGDVRRYKEAKDRIAGVSGRRSRARTEIVKADSPPPFVHRNSDYLYSELLYVTRAYCERGSVKRASRASFSPERADVGPLVLNCVSEVPTSAFNRVRRSKRVASAFSISQFISVEIIYIQITPELSDVHHAQIL